jgi:hypothetical protein
MINRILGEILNGLKAAEQLIFIKDLLARSIEAI